LEQAGSVPAVVGLETVAVVGASLAGVRTVQALRREGYEGRIVLVGEERHWPPVDRPPLSKQVLKGEWEPAKAQLRVGEPFDVELRLGRRAVGLELDGDGGRAVVALDDGSQVEADGVVVATGAIPRPMPGVDPSLGGIHLLRTVDDCLALQEAFTRARRVAVIGSGFIGSEVASSARSLGVDVTVVEALELPLVRVLGPMMGAFTARLHREHGVDLRLGVGVDRIEGADGRVERVVLADGSTVEADVVVVGIGVRPATDWLVETPQLTVDNGLVCDEACVALGSGGRVVAAGDVARWFHRRFGRTVRVEHWTNANDQAMHAAKALVHGTEAAGPFDPVPYFWSDQHGTKFQFLGDALPGDLVEVVEGSVDDGKFVAVYGRDGIVVGALCVNWPARTVPWRERIAAGDTPFPTPAA
jgi:NADPH-dependent 2,4-dienoyl-CoA reductase/sulfur reductase-like enzyme